jgi:ribosome-associated protein
MGNHDEQPSEADAPWVSKRASGPSRSQRRREALDVLALAHALMDAPAGLLAGMTLEDDMRELVATSRAVKTQIARKRQTQFLAKHLRRLEDETLEAMRAHLDHSREHSRADAARLHRLERTRDLLLAGDTAAESALAARHPDLDHGRLHQLVRAARKAKDGLAPPHASRELFRWLRDLDAQATPEPDAGDPADEQP